MLDLERIFTYFTYTMTNIFHTIWWVDDNFTRLWNEPRTNWADLRAQPMPTMMMTRQMARPTNEMETIRRTATH